MRSLRGVDNRTQVFTIDALRFSLLHEARTHLRLMRSLRLAERQAAAGQIAEAVALRALGAAWEIIDTIHRARALAAQVRGLSHKQPELQIFRRFTARTEDLRHFFQHLSTAIPGLSGNVTPILGVLSWATKDPNDSLTIAFSGAPDVGLPGMILDVRAMKFASTLFFTAAGITVDLADIHRRARKFNAFFVDWLSSRELLATEEISVSTLRFRIGLPVGRRTESADSFRSGVPTAL